MADVLIDLYGRMKKALADAGGYEALSGEQRDLFNNAADALMGAKFEHLGTEEAQEAVEAFLDALRPDAEPIPGLSLASRAVLIRAADALDKAGQLELAAELDAILGKGKA